MPIYLQTAIRQHVREHADELRKTAQKERTGRDVKIVMEGLQQVARVEQGPIDVLAGIYRSVPRRRGRAHPMNKKKQGELL
jgi:hypothetical protein